jgi:hypothetical protein
MTKILIDEAVVRQALEALDEVSNSTGIDDYGHYVLSTEYDRTKVELATQVLNKALAEQPAQQCEHRLMISDGDPANDMCEKCGEYVNRKPAQYEPRQSEIFCGVDHADGVLSVSVLRRRTDGVAELIHCEQIELPAPAQPWVGLTDEEFVELCSADLGTAALIRAVEAKLKENNT